MNTLFERLFDRQAINGCIGGCLVGKYCMQSLSNVGGLCSGDTGDIAAQGSGKMDRQEIGSELCQDGRKFENGVFIMRHRAMSGPTICANTETDRAFLCRLHGVVAALVDHLATSATLIEGVLGLNQLWTMLHNPARAVVSTTLLIGGGHIDNVALEPHAASLEQQYG